MSFVRCLICPEIGDKQRFVSIRANASGLIDEDVDIRTIFIETFNLEVSILSAICYFHNKKPSDPWRNMFNNVFE